MKSNNRDFLVNLVAQMMVFATNLIISFFFTPIVLNKLGNEAYGFVGLVNNFVSYISVITVALNSLAGRFITLSYHRHDEKKVREYFSSVFFADTILGVLVLGAAVILCVRIEYLINIPEYLVSDVRTTVILAFFSSTISLIGVVFGVAAFIKNKLYLNSLAQMTANIVRVLVLAATFWLFVPHMWYYSIAAICAGGVTIALQYVFTKKLIPEITIKKEYYNPKRILEILKSGVWLSLESLNKMLQTGLDLLVTNLFVNASAMGLFSIAKQIPVILAQIPQLIANVFNPELAKLYAENKQEELIEKFKFTIRFLSFMMIVPLIGFVVFGKEFYTLWLGNKTVNEINTIQILSILTVLPLLVNAYVEGLYYANTLANKIKGSVIITTIFSVASIGTEFLLLKTTNFNPLIIIAGTSSCYMIVRHAVVTPLYCAYVLKLPKMTFYPALVKSVVISCVIYVLFEGVRRVIVIGSWFKFLFVCAGVGILGYVAACLFKDGEFVFDITNDLDYAKNFAGSKYVKSNPVNIYSKVAKELKTGNKVLFVGLPCQVAAVKNYVKNTDNLYTIDLICHGSPSPQLLEKFLEENKVNIHTIENLKFRNKTAFGLESGYKRISFDAQQDLYTFAFLTSLDYTENCYSCRYATLDRVSDITLGDSWGSELSREEQKKGISLILCQTEKGVELVKSAGFELEEVDLDKAVTANHQLRHPSEMPDKRNTFFENIDRGFHYAISKCYPKMYYKRRLKTFLQKTKIIGGGQTVINEYDVSFKE